MVSAPAPTHPEGQFWPPRKTQTAYVPTPKLFDSVVNVSDLTAASHRDYKIDIPCNRLYGVLVELLDMSDPQALITVEMYGSAEQGSRMYRGQANAGNNWRDEFQQWRYRDIGQSRTLRVGLTNTGVNVVSFNLHIVAEPF